jgi:CPA2 family monovalent cation:H+ antiporter-2
MLAIKRGHEIIEHPAPNEKILHADIAYILGNPEQVNSASEFFKELNDNSNENKEF